jgi:hypothetical protein
MGPVSQNIVIGNEVISVRDAMNLVALIQHDAREMAGEFHGMNRSAKFRANWPNEYEFADANWRTFVQAVRMMYSERLGDPKTSPDDARKMYLAMLVERAFSAGLERMGHEGDTRLQLAPGSQQFEGDAKENKSILENYGTKRNYRAELAKGAAKMNWLK